MSTANGATCPNCGQWYLYAHGHYCPVSASRGVNPNQYPSLWSYTPPPCDHCFCLKPNENGFFANGNFSDGEGPHRQCCKCKTLMAEQFIPALDKDGD